MRLHLSLRGHDDRLAARAELLRALAAASCDSASPDDTCSAISAEGIVYTHLGLSNPEARSGALHMIMAGGALSCEPLLQQLSTTSADEDGAAEALLRTLSLLAKLPILGEYSGSVW